MANTEPTLATTQTSDGKQGGMLKGDAHSAPSGGIQAVVVTDNNKPVLLEGKEVIINKTNVADPEIHTYTGTNAQVLSQINTQGGNGVPIATNPDGTPTEFRYGGSIAGNDLMGNPKTEPWMMTVREYLMFQRHKLNEKWDATQEAAAPNEHKIAVEQAMLASKYNEAIAAGRMSPAEARIIIESAGLMVPISISQMPGYNSGGAVVVNVNEVAQCGVYGNPILRLILGV